MKIIVKSTREVIATIIGGEKLTLDEAYNLMDIKS